MFSTLPQLAAKTHIQLFHTSKDNSAECLPSISRKPQTTLFFSKRTKSKSYPVSALRAEASSPSDVCSSCSSMIIEIIQLRD